MKGNKFWVFVVAIGVMTITTVFFVTMVHNAQTSYANGRFVELEPSLERGIW